jgi:hypothetical protein
MKLIDEFKYALWEDTDATGDEVENKCEKIANNFAIQFSRWLIVHCDYKDNGVWEFKDVKYTHNELLNIFKNKDVNFGYNRGQSYL